MDKCAQFAKSILLDTFLAGARNTRLMGTPWEIPQACRRPSRLATSSRRKWQLGAVNFPSIPIAASVLNSVKPPKDARDTHGAKAPGLPGDADGYCPPKGGPKWGSSPRRRGNGWVDVDGNVWVPSGQGGSVHGGPHWDVQFKAGGYKNKYPGGRER